MQQQLPSMPTMPEQQAIVDMAQWGQPVGWPLGPRAQQPYPAVSVSSVGSVMSAFRRLDVQHVRPLPNRFSSVLHADQLFGRFAGRFRWSGGGSQACRSAQPHDTPCRPLLSSESPACDPLLPRSLMHMCRHLTPPAMP